MSLNFKLRLTLHGRKSPLASEALHQQKLIATYTKANI